MVVIDVEGNILTAWIRGNGPVIMDSDNPYGIEFAIGVRYSAKQKQAFHEIGECKRYLTATDYKAIKYAEGALTEEEYAPIKERRAQARAKINELAFEEPTLTRAEMDVAEKKAMDDLEKEKRLAEETKQRQEEFEQRLAIQQEIAEEVASHLEAGDINAIHVVSNEEFQNILREEEDDADS